MPGKVIDHRNDNDVISHRLNVSANDASNPVLGSGEDLRPYKSVMVEIVITGSDDPGYTITPLFGNTTSGEYHSGEPRNVTTNDRFLCEVDASDDFYVKITGQTGTTPVISIYILPYNA